MLLSLIFPVFNEQDVIGVLLERLRPVLERLACEHEIIFVNDGSNDQTLTILNRCAAFDPRVKVVSFGRNYGHQMAVTAGLDFASGDAVVVMDADLQDPPELLLKMVALYRQGYDIVSPQRVARRTDTAFKRLTAKLFYGLMNKAVDSRLLPEVGDFRLFSAAAVRLIRSFREQHRFMRGMVASLGLKETVVPFERAARAAGESKYPVWKMVRFSWTAITSFSALPLRLTLGAGFALTAIGILYLVYTAFAAVIRHELVPGWTSLVFLQCTFSGALLIGVGLLGEYVAKIYEEIKARPLYVVRETMNVFLDRPIERALVLNARTLAGPQSVPMPLIQRASARPDTPIPA